MADFDNRVAFITGAAHGQGRATALALAKNGADIAAFDVGVKIEYPAYAYGTGEELKSLKAEIEALGRRCEIFAGDVRDDKAVTAAVEGTVAAFGKIDILFNNAGIQQGGSDIATNLSGAINVTEKYIKNNCALRSILFNASASSISGVRSCFASKAS